MIAVSEPAPLVDAPEGEGSSAGNRTGIRKQSARALDHGKAVWLRINTIKEEVFSFEFSPERGKAYIVEGSTDLKQWNPVQTLLGTRKHARFIERRKPHANRQYYRVRVE